MRPDQSESTNQRGGHRWQSNGAYLSSSPRDKHLDARRTELKWAVVKEIEKFGDEAQVFAPKTEEEGWPGRRGVPDEAVQGDAPLRGGGQDTRLPNLEFLNRESDRVVGQRVLSL